MSLIIMAADPNVMLVCFTVCFTVIVSALVFGKFD